MNLGEVTSPDDGSDNPALEEAHQMMPAVIRALWQYRNGEDDQDKWMNPLLVALEKLCDGLSWEDTRHEVNALIEHLAESKRQGEEDAVADAAIARQMASGKESPHDI